MPASRSSRITHVTLCNVTLHIEIFFTTSAGYPEIRFYFYRPAIRRNNGSHIQNGSASFFGEMTAAQGELPHHLYIQDRPDQNPCDNEPRNFQTLNMYLALLYDSTSATILPTIHSAENRTSSMHLRTRMRQVLIPPSRGFTLPIIKYI